MTTEILSAIADVKSDVSTISVKLDAITALVEALPETPPPASGQIIREYGGTLSNGATGKVLNVTAFRWLSDDVDPVVIEVAASTVDLSVNGVGGLDDGAPAANSTYHVFGILNPTTDGTGVIASLSPVLVTPPSGFTVKCRLGSIPTDANGDFIQFSQLGNEFLRDEPLSFPSIASPGILGTLRPTGCPTGIQVHAKLTVALYTGNTAIRSLLISSPDQSDVPATGTRFSLRSSGNTGDRQSSEFLVRTDTSGNFRTRSESSDAVMGIFYTCFGWIDNRGRCL